MEAGKEKSHSRKPTTYSQRLAIRLEAAKVIKGVKNPHSNSAKAFLRRKIREIRDSRISEIGSTKAAQTKKARPIQPEPETKTRPKVYGGQPRNDNPQTRATEAKFAEQERRRTLESRPDSELLDLAGKKLFLEPGELLKFKAPDLHEALRIQYLRWHPSRSRKADLIDMILKAEKAINGDK